MIVCAKPFRAVVCALVSLVMFNPVSGHAQKAHNVPLNALWQPPVSSNLRSHFEAVNGRKVWFVDGLPYTALGAETEWSKITYPDYRKTMGAYDYTFAAAAAIHMNMLKVPVKWSQIEPVEGQFDFSYVDHIRKMAERYHLKIALDWFGHYASGQGTLYSNKKGLMYAPLWIIDDPARFPRAVDGVGNIHQDAASYASSAIVTAESKAFAALMDHIRVVDSKTHTIIAIQVENEVSVFGGGGRPRDNPVYWRDYSAAANKLYQSYGFTDALKFTAWEYSKDWLNPVMESGAAAYKLPFFMNFVGGELESWMVGGSPGEDVGTYLKNIPPLTFIGLNNYVSDPNQYSTDDFREALNRYKVGRNLPTITETNSGPGPTAERSLFLSVGEYGSPLFTPWSLIISVPQKNEPYVLSNGELAHGAYNLAEAYEVLNEALPAISYWGGTPHARVFLSNLPNTPFSKRVLMGDISVTVAGDDNGQAIVLQPSGHELILIGYRCQVMLGSSSPSWPGRNAIDIQSGVWSGAQWKRTGTPVVVPSDGSSRDQIRVYLSTPQVVRVSW